MRGFLGAVTGYPTVFFTFALVVVVGYWVLVLVGGAHLHGARGGHGGGHGSGHGAGHGGHGAGHHAHGSGHGSGHADGHGGGSHGHGQPHSQPQGQPHGQSQGQPQGQPHGQSHSQDHAHGTARQGHPSVGRVLGLGGVPITVSVSLVVAFAWFTSLAGRQWIDGGTTGSPGSRWFLLPLALFGGWAGARLLVPPLRRLMPEPSPPPSRGDFVGLGCVIRTGRVGPDFGQAEVTAADGSSAVVQVRQSLHDAAGSGGSLRSGASALIYDYDADGEFFWVMPNPSSGS